MAVLRIGIVISVQEGPLFTSTETKNIYIHMYGQNLFTVEHILTFVTNHLRIFDF